MRLGWTYIEGMHRAASLTLLLVLVMLVGSAQAQRGGAARGGAVRFGAGPFDGRRGHGFIPRHHHFGEFHKANSIFVPFWYDDSHEYEQPYANEVTNPPAPVIVVQADKPQSVPRELPLVTPHLIEVPGVSDSAVSKPQAPAVFVLANGQRLESRRYLLTAENLNLTIDRQERTISISMLDVNATVAANRQRGIELRIPADRNEISLSF